MYPSTLFKLFFKPTAGWQDLLHSRPSIHRLYLLHVIPFAFIPALMLYLAGGTHGLIFLNLLSQKKLMVVAIAFFLIQLVAVPAMATIIRQLAEVAGIHPTYRSSFILAAVAPTPLWLAPIFLFIPDIYLYMIVSSLSMMAAAGFIYYGIPQVFELEDSGKTILFFGAVLMAGGVAWGFLMAATLVVWGSVQSLPIS